MKLRLTGINEDVYYDSPKAPTVRAGSPVGPEVEPEMRTRVLARLDSGERGLYVNLAVPYEMVRGAEIGDEFTLHLERVKK